MKAEFFNVLAFLKHKAFLSPILYCFLFFIPQVLLAADDSLCQELKSSHYSEMKKSKTIVFFASWCQSCMTSIQQSNPTTDTYIAVFDGQKKAEQALSHLITTKKVRCYWDKDHSFAKALGVDKLPATRKASLVP